jgi:ElaB/YqjD/DUF883 family membrane-anchored ribosome-binding protein
MTNSTVAREKLAKDLKVVIAETEELLKATVGQAGDKIKTARTRVEETLQSAKTSIEELEHEAVESVKAGAKATDVFIHDNPWASIGIAAGAGLVVGWILGRK